MSGSRAAEVIQDSGEQNRGDRVALRALLVQQGFQFAAPVLLVQHARQHGERLGITCCGAASQQTVGLLAEKELTQIDQQIDNAHLHVAMLTDDLQAHDKQIANAADTLAFLTGKYTNQELYEWTVGQVSSVYFGAYKLAFDTAKKAERCFEHELGTDAEFVTGPYWDSLRKGLLAANALLHDIKRMEVAYLDRNRREFELTKHISLAQLDPAALLALRTTGSCDFEVPEVIYDLDYAGHYFRRLKTVSVSIPCVIGPYTTVNATLSLTANRYRARTTMPSSGTPNDRYAENPTGDDRFVYHVGSVQSIATSTGVSDSGTFELNFHDDRYLPFEGCGAIGRWHLELPGDYRQFDYGSISDVLLHVCYTARGDAGLKAVASEALGQWSTNSRTPPGRTACIRR